LPTVLVRAEIEPPPAPRGGDGAWKEPQPFTLFALHAQAVDAAVTPGGLNEPYFFRQYAKERLERPLGNATRGQPDEPRRSADGEAQGGRSRRRVGLEAEAGLIE
jgi:hypothetical protein